MGKNQDFRQPIKHLRTFRAVLAAVIMPVVFGLAAA